MNIEYLITKYNALVYKICYNFVSSQTLAEDLTQETYINYYKLKEKYENLTEAEQKNILCKIALNKCRDYLRSKTLKLENLSDGEESLELIKSDDIMEYILSKEKSEYVCKCIFKLNEPYKSLIYNYYIEGMTLDELAHAKKIPKSTLKTQIYRGKEKLRGIIKSNGGVTYYE